MRRCVGQPLAFLEAHFGKFGAYYYWIFRIEDRPAGANRIWKTTVVSHIIRADPLFTGYGEFET